MSSQDEAADRQVFLRALERLFEEHDHSAPRVFDDPRLGPLLQQYGEARALHWMRLARIRNDHEMEILRRGRAFWAHIEARLQDMPEDTRVGDIMDDQDLDELAFECGLVVIRDGPTFALPEDSP